MYDNVWRSDGERPICGVVLEDLDCCVAVKILEMGLGVGKYTREIVSEDRQGKDSIPVDTADTIRAGSQHQIEVLEMTFCYMTLR